MNTLRRLVGAQSAVLVIPAVGRAVSRCDIELYQVDMLADDVRRRLDLEIVQLVDVGHQVGVVEVDTVVGVGPNHEGLRSPYATECIRHVAVENDDALLAEVPAHLVEVDVEFDDRGLVGPGVSDGSGTPVVTHSVAPVVAPAGLGKGRARNRRHPVDLKACLGVFGRVTVVVGRTGRTGLRPVEGHRGLLHRRAVFGQLEARGGQAAPCRSPWPSASHRPCRR